MYLYRHTTYALLMLSDGVIPSPASRIIHAVGSAGRWIGPLDGSVLAAEKTTTEYVLSSKQQVRISHIKSIAIKA